MRLIVLALLLAGPVQAGTRQQAVTLLPEDPQSRKFHEDWGFSEAIVTGDTVYVSGVVVGMPREGSDLRGTYTRGFEHIAQILHRAGVSWDDVIDLTSYHTDLTAQMPAIVEVKNNFVKAPYPAWTAVQVSRLIPDRGITELKVIARMPAKPKSGKKR